MAKNFDLTGKIALITGASYGIGYAIAKGLHAAGAKIVFNDIKQEFVDKGLASYEADGIKAHGYVCDVTDEDAVNAMVATIVSGLSKAFKSAWHRRAPLTRTERRAFLFAEERKTNV